MHAQIYYIDEIYAQLEFILFYFFLGGLLLMLLLRF